MIEQITPENITALSTLLLIGSLGGKVSTRDGQLYVTGIKSMHADVRKAITRNKAELIRMAGGA